MQCGRKGLIHRVYNLALISNIWQVIGSSFKNTKNKTTLSQI